ncbi:MAG: hypothetical protein WBG36_10390 [Ornithinimicrobium sp.]
MGRDCGGRAPEPLNRNAAGFLKFFAVAASLEQVGTPVGTQSLEDFYTDLAQRDR